MCINTSCGSICKEKVRVITAMINFFDSTLRDGSHAVAHKLTLDNIQDYCTNADDIGFHTIIVGHGNGLGASSLNVGFSLNSDIELLKTAKKNLKNTLLGGFLLPGFGTIKDDLIPAFEAGLDLVCVASHCTEADITKQYIEYIRQQQKEVYGVLMLQHTIDHNHILEECKKMQSYGAMGIILMDSAGASLPDFVGERINILVNNLSIPVGFHAHNNLSLAIANSVEAVKAGATIIDGTVNGFGAGAGNCQLEVLVAVLEKMGIDTNIDLYKTMDLASDVVSTFSVKQQGISEINLISGIAGVFSSYAPHVEAAAKQFGVDARDIFLKMGERKTVGGQEDIIVEVAAMLANQKIKKQAMKRER